MLTSSKLDKPSMQARKSGHTTHHSTHRVVRPHAEDTPRLYARRLRGRVFKRSPIIFVVTPLSAKTTCPSGNCSPMAFWLFAMTSAAGWASALLISREFSVASVFLLLVLSPKGGLMGRARQHVQKSLLCAELTRPRS